MGLDERDRHALLTHLTTVVMGLQILQRRTPLSGRQARVVEQALRGAQQLRGLLLHGLAAEGPPEPSKPAGR